MGWREKSLKRHKAEQMAKEIISSKKYQDARKADMEQAALDAYCRFCLVACDYLQINFGCKRNGIMKFLKYATEIMKYTLEDDKYFEDMNQVMIDECGVDVLEELGMKVVKGEKE